MGICWASWLGWSKTRGRSPSSPKAKRAASRALRLRFEVKVHKVSRSVSRKERHKVRRSRWTRDRRRVSDMSDSESDFDDAPEEAAAAEAADVEAEARGEPNEFDECCEKGMAHVKESEWVDATSAFERALAIDKKEEGEKEVSEERSDCAFNLACCHCQCGKMEQAEQWLRRAVAWGVRGVDIMTDEHLAPLREANYVLFVNLSEALRPPPTRAPAVLQRSKRERKGTQMQALIKAERERQDDMDEDEVDDFWKDEEGDGEFSEEGSDHEHRDWFDSDFDESESDDDDDGDGDGDGAKGKSTLKGRKRPKPGDSAKPEPTVSKRSRRAAAQDAEARTAAELADAESGDEDVEDGDFADAEADRAIAAAGGAEAFAGDRAAPTARDAIRQAKRQKAAAEAAADLGLGDDESSDDDAAAAAAAAAPNKAKKTKKKKKKKKQAKDALSLIHISEPTRPY